MLSYSHETLADKLHLLILDKALSFRHVLLRLLALQVLIRVDNHGLKTLPSTMASLQQPSFADASSTLPSADGWQRDADAYSMLNAVGPVEMCSPARRLRRRLQVTFSCWMSGSANAFSS